MQSCPHHKTDVQYIAQRLRFQIQTNACQTSNTNGSGNQTTFEKLQAAAQGTGSMFHNAHGPSCLELRLKGSGSTVWQVPRRIISCLWDQNTTPAEWVRHMAGGGWLKDPVIVHMWQSGELSGKSLFSVSNLSWTRTLWAEWSYGEKKWRTTTMWPRVVQWGGYLSTKICIFKP